MSEKNRGSFGHILGRVAIGMVGGALGGAPGVMIGMLAGGVAAVVEALLADSAGKQVNAPPNTPPGGWHKALMDERLARNAAQPQPFEYSSLPSSGPSATAPPPPPYGYPSVAAPAPHSQVMLNYWDERRRQGPGVGGALRGGSHFNVSLIPNDMVFIINLDTGDIKWYKIERKYLPLVKDMVLDIVESKGNSNNQTHIVQAAAKRVKTLKNRAKNGGKSKTRRGSVMKYRY